MSIMYCLHTIQSAIHIIGYNIKLYNVNANCNDEIEIHNDSPYPNDDTFCMHYAPYQVAQTIGNEKKSIIPTFIKLLQHQCQLRFVKSANL